MAKVLTGRRQTCVLPARNVIWTALYKKVERVRVETETIAMSLSSFGFSSSKRGATESRSETESPSTDADCPAGQPSGSAERPAAKKRTKVFQVSWLSDPECKSWLAYDETNEVMTCRFCLASNFDKNFTRRCRDLQRSALVRQINPIICKDHSRAVADAEQRKANAIAVQNALTFQEAAVDCKNGLLAGEGGSRQYEVPFVDAALTMFGDPDVHRLRAEDPTRRGMSLTYESSQSFIINWQFCSAKFDMKSFVFDQRFGQMFRIRFIFRER